MATLCPMLIVGPPTPERDFYELALRRRCANVITCDNGRVASGVLGDQAVRAAFLLGPLDKNGADELIQLLKRDQRQVPIFYVGTATSRQDLRVLEQPGVAVVDQRTPPEMVMRMLTTLVVDAGDSAEHPTDARVARTVAISAMDYPLRFQMAKALFESEFIVQVLRACRGNVSRAARQVGLARRSLQLKIVTYGIDVDEIRRAYEGIW